MTTDQRIRMIFANYLYVGKISLLNQLAAEHNAKAIIHTGDFGFYGSFTLLWLEPSSPYIACIQRRRPCHACLIGRSGIWCSTQLSLIHSSERNYYNPVCQSLNSVRCCSTRLCDRMGLLRPLQQHLLLPLL